MFTDRYGLALSTPVSAAADHYIAAADLLLANQPGAELAIQAALSADPEFGMGHAALARHHQMWGRATEARAAIANARKYSAKATRREQQHIALQATLISGDAPQALCMLLEHLEDFPRDALALGMALGAFGMLAFSGRPDHDAARLVMTEGLARAYGDDWWYLCYLAWAHIEVGSLVAGEQYIEKSLARKSDNANGMHVFAHLAYEQNRASEANARLDFMSANYSGKALLHNHLRWHVALGELAAGRAGAALQIYDQYLSPEVATAAPITAISDAVSLLWRIDVAGQESGITAAAGSDSERPTKLRWQALRESVRARHYQPTVAFLDVHVAALFGSAEERPVFEALVAQINESVNSRRLPAGLTSPALCRALQAFAQGDYEETIRLLEANLGNIARIGGSGAQRDLFEETLARAYQCVGRTRERNQLLVWGQLRAVGRQ